MSPKITQLDRGHEEPVSIRREVTARPTSAARNPKLLILAVQLRVQICHPAQQGLVSRPRTDDVHGKSQGIVAHYQPFRSRSSSI